ncbi:Uma2 family endonuclease [Streptomyces antibioticus]|uniref:Uma2 family endonuclease n=1 Tax=Streptomyces TaxID=1883 RepID=UPI0015875E47|nr:Uma2 family endonuclease [Streptomyces sp. CAI-85]MBO7940397.1 Uma2 family endonuclease [Streptomyces sp. S9]NUV64851.1 Uma2 family endonuclease [Streptomyces sp. CAI-85]
MSAGAVERPERDRPLIVAADRLMQHHPGHRVEVIGSQILVSPLRDGPHAVALTELMLRFMEAGLHDGGSALLQGIGLWLPTGAEDYAIPDLSLVDADYTDHHAENNCYDPGCFRLVLEVTSENHRTDLRTKVAAYAEAKIPVYVVVDREHQRLHVFTEPVGDTYVNHHAHAPGEMAALPDSVGAEVALDVAAVLEAGS